MNILAFGASTSRTSINQRFAHFAAHQFDGTVNLIDLNDFQMPLFSVDIEEEFGIPDEAIELLEIIGDADFLVISMAEHNGNYTAAFKNTLDWMSRAKASVFQDKPLLLLSTSPGGLGAKFSLEAALSRFPRHAANIIGHFSLPSFNDNFDTEITNNELAKEFQAIIAHTKETLAQIK
jgi:NAD(P)H-dependent FMN reductase